MTKTVRFALIIAFIIFVAGIIWAVTFTRRDKKEITIKTTETPTLVGSPSSTTAPAATPAAPAPTAPAPTPTPKKTVTTYRIVTVEEPSNEASASAWASAGTNADGSTYAEAHAE